MVRPAGARLWHSREGDVTGVVVVQGLVGGPIVGNVRWDRGPSLVGLGCSWAFVRVGIRAIQVGLLTHAACTS
jgi:hypothetical protein